MREGGKPLPLALQYLIFFGIKALLFEFGNNIFTGFKMPFSVGEAIFLKIHFTHLVLIPA